MYSAFGRFLAQVCSVAVLSLAAASAWADDFCCQCKGGDKSFSVEASDELTAGLECSLKCKRPTRAKAGKCAAPAASSAPTAAASGKGNSMRLFASDDCSGAAKTVSASTARLADAAIAGARSYQLDTGAAAGVWEKADYAGRKVEMVGPGLCIAPGWEIGSVRFMGQ
jgi:hypothetical protein